MEPLQRLIFIKNQAPEFELEPENCFELIRPLNGLEEIDDIWHRSMEKHLINDMT